MLNHEMKIHVIKFLRYLSNGAEVVDLLLECRIVENVLVAMTSFPFSSWRLINEELIQPRQLDRKARRHYDYGMEAYGCGVGEALQVYEELQNAQTVKGVNVFGANTEYVVSGSDCGRIFIWKKKGGQLVHLMKGDKEVVNCLEPHPYATILATSGIEKNIKVWSPTASHLIPLPDNVEELMEANKRKREQHARISFTPDVIMHVLRLQRRVSERDGDRRISREDFEGEDDEDDDMDGYAMDLTTDGDDSSEDGDHVNPRDCIIS